MTRFALTVLAHFQLAEPRYRAGQEFAMEDITC